MLDWKSPLSLDAVIDRGLALFNATLPRVAAFAVLVGIAANLVAERMVGVHEQEIAALLRAGELAQLGERFGATFAALGVLMLYVNSAVLHLVGTLARGRPGDPLGSLGATLRRMPHLLVGGLLYFCALWLGLLLLVLPGLWVAVALSFFVQAVLFDDHDGVRALGASLRLVRGRWWRTLALYLLVTVAMLLALLVAGLAVGLVGGMIGWIAGGRLPLVELMFGSAIGSILGLAVDSVLVAYYHDLALRAGDAGGAPPPAPGSIAA